MRTMIHISLIAMSLAGCTAAQAPAATREVTPATLAARLEAAKGGDTLKFTGRFGAIVLPQRTYRPPLTLDLRGATLTVLKLDGLSGVRALGGRVVPSEPKPAAGVSVRNSRNVHVTGMTITGTVSGIGVITSEDVAILNNTLSGMGADGINLGGSRVVLVEGNRCSNFLTLPQYHPDCIQGYPVRGYRMSDITIRGNVAQGEMQNIFMKGEDGDGSGFDRVTIENNEALVASGHGVSLSNARDSVVRNNRVRAIPGRRYQNGRGYPMQAWAKATGERNLVCGNVTDFPKDPSNAPCPR